MAQFLPYSFAYVEQVQWFQIFKENIFEKIKFIYDDYNYYMKYPTSRQLNKTYTLIVDTIHELNKYLADVTQYIRSEERLYPNMTHKKTLTFVLQIAKEFKSHEDTINRMYYTIQKLYKHNIPAVPVMLDRLEPFVLQPDQEGFCIN
jgi:hypothetical protein